MSHQAVRALIEDTVRKIQDDIKFFYGPEPYFNEEEKNAFTFCNLAPLRSAPGYTVNNVFNYTKVWTVQMAFYKHDDKSKRKFPDILDVTDDLVDRFVNRLNQEQDLTITAVSSEPMIEVLADVLTGHLLTFSIQVADNFQYCEEC